MKPAVSTRGSRSMNRRHFFGQMSDGIYGIALTKLLSFDLFGSSDVAENKMFKLNRSGQRYDVKAKKPHFEGKAKSVILLFMNGAPSPMDLLDPKPMLDKHHGEPFQIYSTWTVRHVGFGDYASSC